MVVDHTAELHQVEALAAAAGRTQSVLVRVTPGIEADTHRKIATGHAASKFGLPPAAAVEALRIAAGLEHVRPAGLHVHLGSQIHDVGTYLEAAEWLAGFIAEHDLGRLPVLDLGGGLAIAYTDDDSAPDVRAAVEATAAGLAGLLAARGLPLPELILEPGRSIAGPAGVTLYTVGSIKRTGAGITYAAVDGGMADNPRPAMYGARYQAFMADRAAEPATHTYAIAGKHCESGDVLIEAAALPQLRPGDVIALAATGAYTATMSSTYNGLPRPAAVMVADGAERTVVARETVADLLVARALAVLEQADVLGLRDGLRVGEAVDEQVARLAPGGRVDERPGDRSPRRDRHLEQVRAGRSPRRPRGSGRRRRRAARSGSGRPAGATGSGSSR